MHLINNPNIELVKKEIRKIKENHKDRAIINEINKLIIVQAQDEEFNRKIIESGKFDILIGLDNNNKKNKIRQNNSGLDMVVAKIAHKNNISIGIKLGELKKNELISKGDYLSKLSQNIEICKKTKTNFACKEIELFEWESILEILGASSSQISKTLTF